jgi:hypothetical protein
MKKVTIYNTGLNGFAGKALKVPNETPQFTCVDAAGVAAAEALKAPNKIAQGNALGRTRFEDFEP